MLEKTIQNLEIHHHSSLEEYLKHWKKFYAFSKEGILTTRILTDGVAEQEDIWIEKNPGFYDQTLVEYPVLYRSVFLIQDMRYVLLEREFLKDSRIDRQLYGPIDSLEKLISNNIEITVSGLGKLKIRKKV